MKLEEMAKGVMIFRCPDKIHNTYGIEIYKEKDHSTIIKFDYIMRTKMNEKKHLHYFEQGRTINWSYFEFFNGEKYQDEILQIAEEIAKHFNLPLIIEWKENENGFLYFTD